MRNLLTYSVFVRYYVYMKNLTKRQQEILGYIKDYLNNHGIAPSYREIGRFFGLSSTATISEHIEALRAKGYLTSESHLARSIALTEDPLKNTISVPLLGAIAAGQPIEAIRTHETIDIPQDMADKNTFALRVRGNSMIEDSILDGDYVIIEATSNIKNGDIVVALVNDGEVTLKRFYKESNGIRLQPANATMQPIFVKDASIQGKVKGVIRRFPF